MMADDVLESWLNEGKSQRGTVGQCQKLGYRFYNVAPDLNREPAEARVLEFVDGSRLVTTGKGRGWQGWVNHP